MGESKMISYFMDQFPTGILSIVSDTFDLWTLITKYLPENKEQIMSRDGKLVIRPDSGDPVDIICGEISNPNIKPTLGEKYVDMLTGKTVLFVTNLKPVKMMGIESTAMIMPGFYDVDGNVTLSTIDSKPGLSIL
jgi:nicotinic acid phosphoribosyltransferase